MRTDLHSFRKRILTLGPVLFAIGLLCGAAGMAFLLTGRDGRFSAHAAVSILLCVASLSASRALLSSAYARSAKANRESLRRIGEIAESHDKDARTIASVFLKLINRQKPGAWGLCSTAASPSADAEVAAVQETQNRITERFHGIMKEFDICYPAACKRVFYVGSDTYREGYECGLVAGDFLGGKGRVAAISGIRMNMQIRLQGFKAALSERYPGIMIAEIGLSQGQPDISYSYAMIFLKRYPDLGIIYIAEGISAEAVMRAISESGRAGRVRIVCHDLLAPIAAGLADGSVIATVCQDAFAQGFDTPVLLYDHIVSGWTPAEPRILNPCQLVTASNYREFLDGQPGALKPRREPSSMADVASPSGKRIRIGFICPSGRDFWLQVLQGAEAAKEALSAANCGLEIVRIERVSFQAFRREIERFAAEGFDGICTFAMDPSLVPFINQACDSGVKVATFNAEPAALEANGREVPLDRGADGSGDGLSGPDDDLLMSLSAQASLAVENSRLYETEREQRVFAEALVAFAESLNSMQDTDDILGLLLDDIAKVFDFESASIFMVERDVARVIRTHGYAEISQSAAAFMAAADFKISEIPTFSEIVLTGHVVIIDDTRLDPRWKTFSETEFIRSWIGCPIQVGGEVLAFFSLDKADPGFFTQKQSDRLQAFAGQAALAIQNAKLFAELSRLATTDPLTGLANRREFSRRGTAELDRCRRYGREVSLLMLDLDHFKSVNDCHGHAVGDSVLVALAEKIQETLRAADIACRFGGEEFVVLAPETTLPGAFELAERVRGVVAGMAVAFGDVPGSVSVTVSVGIAVSSGRKADLELLLDEADKALYAAKSAGRNCSRVWDSDLARATLFAMGEPLA